MKINEVARMPSRIEILLTFQSQYNGWSVEGIGEKKGEELSDILSDTSYEWADEDGEYGYGDRDLLDKHKKIIKQIVSKQHPKSNITIKFDGFSS